MGEIECKLQIEWHNIERKNRTVPNQVNIKNWIDFFERYHTFVSMIVFKNMIIRRLSSWKIQPLIPSIHFKLSFSFLFLNFKNSFIRWNCSTIGNFFLFVYLSLEFFIFYFSHFLWMLCFISCSHYFHSFFLLNCTP